jgi:hypothetical protein
MSCFELEFLAKSCVAGCEAIEEAVIKQFQALTHLTYEDAERILSMYHEEAQNV